MTASTGWAVDSPLLEATITAVRDRRPELVAEPATLKFTTNIPRQVGLSGSSAIIMAALRALAARRQHEWDPVELARLTLEVETEVLGWSAGPQDRVVQSFEGLIDMDFSEPWQPSRYQQLDPGRLPPLFVAWSRTAGDSSDVAHSDVRQRWQQGDTEIHQAMTRFAELAALGRAALDRNDAAQVWPALLDEAFELRSRFWHITKIDTALVAAGRRSGAGVAFAGSGGAVVGAVSDAGQLETAAEAYDEVGAGFLVVKP